MSIVRFDNFETERTLWCIAHCNRAGLSSTSSQRTMQPVAQAYVVKCISRSSFIYVLGRAIERRILLLETYLGGRVSSSDEENILSLDFRIKLELVVFNCSLKSRENTIKITGLKSANLAAILKSPDRLFGFAFC